jgi:hypothetical protein
MPPKTDNKGKGKDGKKLEPVYSEVNVCWKRDKELEAAASKAGQIDEDTKNKMSLEICELQSRTERLLCCHQYRLDERYI